MAQAPAPSRPEAALTPACRLFLKPSEFDIRKWLSSNGRIMPVLTFPKHVIVEHWDAAFPYRRRLYPVVLQAILTERRIKYRCCRLHQPARCERHTRFRCAPSFGNDRRGTWPTPAFN
jgi:hypothetical protein